MGTLVGLGTAANPANERFDYPLVIAQAARRPAAAVAGQGGAFVFEPTPQDGGRICLLSTDGVFSVLTREFASAAQPSLSYDAKRILFAGKRSPLDAWNVWEMSTDGKNKRKLTDAFGNCLEPSYLATSSITPPEFADKVRWILFSSDQAGAYEEDGPRPARALYAMNIEPIAGRGTVTRRTTFNLSSDFSPTVIGDGRVLFTSHQPGGPGNPDGRYPLLVTNWDGTGLNLFYDTHEGRTLTTMPCEMPDRTLVFVESQGTIRDGEGQLARVSFKRPLHSREVLSTGQGTYLNPRPVPDGRLLVSYSSGNEARAICLFDFATGLPGLRIHQDSKWDDQLALAVVERAEPQGLLSAVVDSDMTADLHCIDVYESDLAGVKNIRKGEVKTARLVEGVPVLKTGPPMRPLPGHCAATNLRLRILGEVPVEPDGSFMVRLPADTPFFVQLLDARGMALETQRGWIWVRRGTSRQCLGCHEDKELAPENRTTEALVKIRRHSLLQPPEKRRAAADFKRALTPIVQARCGGCHRGAKASGGVDLSVAPTKYFNRAFETLRSRAGDGYLKPGDAKNSALIRMFVQAALRTAPGTGHPAVPFTEAEKKALVEWIDLGARWEN